MPEVKIDLKPILNGQIDGEPVTLISASPQEDLEEWLVSTYNMRLDEFKLVGGKWRGQSHRLVSRNNPNLWIYIDTSYIERTHPRNVVNFRTRKKGR